MDLSKIGSHGLEDIISGMAPPPPVTPQSPNPISSMAQPSISPMDVLQGAQLPQQQLNMSGMQSTMPQPAPHGMFGIHGTARDILGMLGDAFLVQSGNKRVYAPQLAAEQEEQAMRGFTDDPMAAAERLGQTNPDAARKFYNDTIDAKRRGQTADEQYNGLILGRAMSLVGTGNADNWPAVRQRALDYAKSKGVPIPDLPQNYDPEAIRQAMLSAVSPERQMYYDLAGRKIEHTDARADQRDDTTRRGQDIGERIATGHDKTSKDNNIRSTSTSADNNYRSTQTSRENTESTNQTTETVAGIRDARAERHEAKTPVTRVLNGRNEVVVGYKDGTTQTFRNSHAIGGKGRRNFGGGGGAPAAAQPAGPVQVHSAADYNALPRGAQYIDPHGIHKTKQ